MKSLTSNIIFKIAVVLFAVLCISTVVRLQLKNNSLKQEEAELKVKVEALDDKVRELQNKLDSPFDENYVIELAKEKLRLRLPEEIIFYNDN